MKYPKVLEEKSAVFVHFTKSISRFLRFNKSETLYPSTAKLLQKGRKTKTTPLITETTSQFTKTTL